MHHNTISTHQILHPAKIPYLTSIQIDQHSPLTEKSHCERAGVHRAYNMMTQPKSAAVVRPEEHQRKIRCAGLGARSFVNRETTASFGIANDKIPGQKAAMVYLITFCCCSRVRVSKCRPLPASAAALEMPRLIMPQICSVVSRLEAHS